MKEPELGMFCGRDVYSLVLVGRFSDLYGSWS